MKNTLKIETILLNKICIKYNCFIFGTSLLYRECSESKYSKIGDIYYKSKPDLYYSKSITKNVYSGEKDFENALIKFLKGEKVI